MIASAQGPVRAPKAPRTRWSGAEPPSLPPLTRLQRWRLAGRLIWAVVALVGFFSVFLVLRGIDWLLGRALGRRVTAMAPAVVQVWAAQAIRSLGLRYVQRGEPMRQGGAFVANHSSWIDIWALQRATAPFLVSKAEVRDWPGIGLIGRAIGTMFIDRSPAQAKVQEAELLARMARGDRMAIFPEGTSTDGQRILPFKSALFGVFFAPELSDRVAVQPVTIRYFPPASLPAAFYGWWGEMDFARHLVDVLARSVGGTVELTFHPALHPEELSGRKEMAAAAEAAVRAGFQTPTPES